MDQVVNLFILREHGLIKMLANRTPVVETYLQNLTADPQLGPVPSEDHYFLGRLDMGETVDRKDYLKGDGEKSGMGGMESRLLGGFHKLYKVQYEPVGFSWMVYADRTDFDREHYDFHYIRREFLGDVRCLVFDVTPKPKSGRGRFLGRVWVEDQDFNIVRLNGTYAPAPRNSYFFHMDSWRLNLIPGYWVPSLHLQRGRRLQRWHQEQAGLQGADPHLGLRFEEGRQGRRTDQHPRRQRAGQQRDRAGCVSAAG